MYNMSGLEQSSLSQTSKNSKPDGLKKRTDNQMSDNTSVRGSKVKTLSLDRAKSPWTRAVDFDIHLTSKAAVCSSRESRYGYFRPLMKFIEISCHGVPWIGGTVVAIAVTHKIWIHEKLFNLLLALLVDLLVVAVVKLVTRRPRPVHNRMDMFATVSVDKFSFPSGHASRASTVACFLIDHFCTDPFCVSGVIVWSVVVGISRVLLGRHHVGDVICGLIIGVLQYKLIVQQMWLSAETCESIIRPLQEDLHL